MKIPVTQKTWKKNSEVFIETVHDPFYHSEKKERTPNGEGTMDYETEL